MRITLTLLILFSLLCAVRSQIPPSATNRVTVAEAIKIVSGLRVGMKEDDADDYLLHHGINGRAYNTNGTVLVYRASSGDNFFWTTGYPLKGGYGLGLNYSNAYTGTNEWARNGILQGAVIQSNFVNIISITLTNSE